MTPRLAGTYLVVANDKGIAEIVLIPGDQNPDVIARDYLVLGSYNSREQAEERRDIESDPVKREAFALRATVSPSSKHERGTE